MGYAQTTTKDGWGGRQKAPVSPPIFSDMIQAFRDRKPRKESEERDRAQHRLILCTALCNPIGGEGGMARKCMRDNFAFASASGKASSSNYFGVSGGSSAAKKGYSTYESGRGDEQKGVGKKGEVAGPERGGGQNNA